MIFTAQWNNLPNLQSTVIISGDKYSEQDKLIPSPEEK